MQHATPAPIRVGLLGGECTGKSTLAGALAAALPACLAPEVAREFVRREGRPPRVDEQAAVLAQQAESAARVAATCPLGLVVVDPVPLMTALYSVLYFGDDTLIPVAVDDAITYDLLVWCAPDLPWSADPGMRDGPAFRDAAERLVSDVVHGQLRPRGGSVVRVTGALDDRIASVSRALARTGAGRAWQRGGTRTAT